MPDAIDQVLDLVDPLTLPWIASVAYIPALQQSLLTDWRQKARSLVLTNAAQTRSSTEQALFNVFPIETARAIGWAPAGPLAQVNTLAGPKLITPEIAATWGRTGVLGQPVAVSRRRTGLAVSSAIQPAPVQLNPTMETIITREETPPVSLPPAAAITSGVRVIDAFTGDVIAGSLPSADPLKPPAPANVAELRTESTSTPIDSPSSRDPLVISTSGGYVPSWDQRVSATVDIFGESRVIEGLVAPATDEERAAVKRLISAGTITERDFWSADPEVLRKLKETVAAEVVSNRAADGVARTELGAVQQVQAAQLLGGGTAADQLGTILATQGDPFAGFSDQQVAGADVPIDADPLDWSTNETNLASDQNPFADWSTNEAEASGAELPQPGNGNAGNVLVYVVVLAFVFLLLKESK